MAYFAGPEKPEMRSFDDYSANLLPSPVVHAVESGAKMGA
jgi:hypothetical protein